MLKFPVTPRIGNLFRKERKFSLRFHLISALALFIFDAVFIDQGVLTFLVVFFFFLRLLLISLWDIFHKRSFNADNLKRFAIYCFCLLAVGFFLKFNNRNAQTKAEVIIKAVKAYKAKNHEYPKKLDSLVPEFLPSIPAAKFNYGGSNRFYYFRNDNNASLFYVSFPPYGRPTYNFERDHWGYID